MIYKALRTMSFLNGNEKVSVPEGSVLVQVPLWRIDEDQREYRRMVDQAERRGEILFLFEFAGKVRTALMGSDVGAENKDGSSGWWNKGEGDGHVAGQAGDGKLPEGAGAGSHGWWNKA